VLNKGLRLTLQIYADLGNLGGRTQFDVVRMSNSSSRLPIRLQNCFRSNRFISGLITVFPVELRRMTSERLRRVGMSRRRIPIPEDTDELWLVSSLYTKGRAQVFPPRSVGRS